MSECRSHLVEYAANRGLHGLRGFCLGNGLNCDLWDLWDCYDKRLYCHRKFRPLSKPRLCYNNNLLERSIRWPNEEDSRLNFRSEVVIEALSGESSQAELCRRYNLSADQLSKWKQQFIENAASLFESRDKASEDAAERIAHLEQLVGRLTVALDIPKKALGKHPSKLGILSHRCIIRNALTQH